MLLVWKGWGFLPIIIAIVSAILGGFTQSPIGVGVALLIGAAVTWFAGKKLNSYPAQILVDQRTNQTVELKKTHSMFWIPMQYYALPMIIIAAILLWDSFTAA